MSTQFYSSQIKLYFPNPEKSLQFRQVEESEFDNLFHDHIQGEDENAEDVQMADHLRLMEEPLRIPIVGIENAIVVPAVLANEFELKTELLDFIRAAETWLENEPPCSITTWDDLVSKFLNRFYPHSKTRELRKEIMNFQQVFAGGNLMMRNIQEALTTIENKARVRTCRNKPQVSSSGGTSTQIDAITALTKQVEALEYHFASMRETYDQNQEAAFQLIQNQMSQIAEDLQESPLGVLPRNTVTDPLDELNVITSMDGLTLDGSFTPHSNFLVYQEEEQEPKTITEVVEIASSKSTPLVPPPETPPLSTPKSKENLEPNPHQPSIPYPSRLKEENFQALENPTRRADHFVYRIDIDSESLLEETDTLLSQIDDSFPEYETFCLNIKEKISGSTTSHSDLSLPDYEVFCFEEKSSGSTTSHSNHSLPEYDSFIFDLSIDPFPSADRSVSHHEEFADELAHIISPPKYEIAYQLRV
ncbi:reverse transcriptase domain-containing protein [Tanacetum coccineum]